MDSSDAQAGTATDRGDWRGLAGHGLDTIAFEELARSRREGCRYSSRLNVPETLPLLTEAVEQAVIPRLLLASRPGATASTRRPVAAEILRLTDLALAREDGGVIDYIARMTLSGMAAEAVFVDLLTPVARRLGEFWEADLCTFTEVTVGVMRLQQALRGLIPEFQDAAVAQSVRGQAGYRALLVPTLGEQHSFGLVMVAEYFRRAGWGVSGGAALSSVDLLKRVRAEHYAVVGFSVGSERQLDVLAACIRQVRRVSRNPEIGILVGGPLFMTQPDLVARIGADATGADGRDAVRQAQRLTAERA
jgi:methanogenic corrinoid protein MtbC1